ncbi:hypothetical protein [Micromonospora sicca]|uniref:hypothetical protein n=1 Tax=Micromonospora sicca TaxID=2202420 RepID=UPI00191C3528|nr:hypothetical protein [Micromonospora sp. 4G51]
MQILRVHRRYEQDRRAEAAENGKPWTDTGYVFNRSDGKPINPNYATTRFRILVRRTGLPPGITPQAGPRATRRSLLPPESPLCLDIQVYRTVVALRLRAG